MTERSPRKGHLGSSIDDFLKREGIFEDAQEEAIKEVVAWQLDRPMKDKEGIKE